MFRYEKRGRRRRLNGQQVCVDGHADDCVGADCIEGVNFLLAANSPGHDELALRQFAQTRGDLEREALQGSFRIHVRVEKCRDVGLELRNCVVGR